MKKNKAFTIAETLIVLGIISFLAIILISSLNAAVPDREVTYFKKAYSIAERVIGELINDELYYPYDLNRTGFLNTDCVSISGTANAVGTGTCPTGFTKINENKFCELFKSKVNVIQQATATNHEELWAGSSANDCIFQTSDGIVWRITDEFKCDLNAAGRCSATSTNSLNIQIDYDLELQGNDPFEIAVLSNGKIEVNGDREKEYLSSHNLRK